MQAFETLTNMSILKLEGSQNSKNFCKSKSQTYEIVLNLPLSELEDYVTLKKSSMPAAFQEFCDFV